MARVFIPALLQNLSGGKSPVEAGGGTVEEVIENLDRLCPGLKDRFVEGGQLRPGISVAVDGEITPAGLRERVEPDSEIHFVPAVKGG